MLNTPVDDMNVSDEKELLAVLANDNLPGIIAADQGAVARKGRGSSEPSCYRFLGGSNDAPSVMILIDQLVEELGAGATLRVGSALAVVRAHLAIDLVSRSAPGDLVLTDPGPLSPMAS